MILDLGQPADNANGYFVFEQALLCAPALTQCGLVGPKTLQLESQGDRVHFVRGGDFVLMHQGVTLKRTDGNDGIAEAGEIALSVLHQSGLDCPKVSIKHMAVKSVDDHGHFAPMSSQTPQCTGLGGVGVHNVRLELIHDVSQGLERLTVAHPMHTASHFFQGVVVHP